MKTRPLSRSEEKKLLASILCQLDGVLPDSLWTRIKREIWTVVVSLVAALILIIAATGPGWMALLMVGGAFLVGVVAGIQGWRIATIAQWPAVARCIDRNRVEARLRELDA